MEIRSEHSFSIDIASRTNRFFTEKLGMQNEAMFDYVSKRHAYDTFSVAL